MYATILNKLRWSYRKNWPDIKGLFLRHYPEFVLSNSLRELGEEIPVFCFHSVEPEDFEAKLDYLKSNDYATLDGDALLKALRRETPLPKRAVVLTFDDGTATLYSVAWPLLRKYGFQAISFLIPGCIPETAPKQPMYEDWAAGDVEKSALLEREKGDFPLCSWQEIREMHASGVIDFQAHTMHHHLIHVAPQLVDFIHPNYDFYFYANIHVPVYYSQGQPDFSRKAALGTPVYRAEPHLCGRAQFFDDESARRTCVEYVVKNGGERFFEREDWRKELLEVHRNASKSNGQTRFESTEETRETIFQDFAECKRQIEENIPGKKVEHFCFPWFIGSNVAVEMAQKAGFQALYWGILNVRRTNRPGDDPLRVMRVEDRYLERLPGDGRKSLREILAGKINTNLPLFRKRLNK